MTQRNTTQRNTTQCNVEPIFNAGKLDNVQALRGIAALLVLILHTTSNIFPDTPNSSFPGAIGVDIFFCISGFIMMYVTQENSHAFLRKRAVRVIPLYWIATLGFVAEGYILRRIGFTVPEWLIPFVDAKRLLNSLSFGLFLPYPNPCLAAGWTLNAEVVFYLVFALACKVSIRYRGIIAMMGLWTLSIVFSGLGWNHSYDRWIEFCYGIGAFYIVRWAYERQLSVKHAGIWLILLCSAVFVWNWLAYSKQATFFGVTHYAIRYGIPGAIVAISTCVFTRNSPKWLTALGDISYSVYLLHIPVYHFFTSIAMTFDLPRIGLFASVVLTALTLALTLLLSRLSFILIEKRLTNVLRKFVV